MKGIKKMFAAVIVVSFLLNGCYGSFAAFNKLRSWNQTASNEKWVNEVIYLALNIIPVYGIALFADAIIFNSVAFWTGENPMENAKFSMDKEREAVQKFSRDENGKHMQLLVYNQGNLEQVLSLNQAAGSSTLSGELARTDGRTEKVLVQPDEQGIRVLLTDASGRITSRCYTGESLDQVRINCARALSQGQLAMVRP